jgi:DNA-directed RNA polymerase specialized sigma24 family protein
MLSVSSLSARIGAALARNVEAAEALLFSDPLLVDRFARVARAVCQAVPNVNDAHAEIQQQARLELLEDVRRRGLLVEWARCATDTEVLQRAGGAWRKVLAATLCRITRADCRQPRGPSAAEHLPARAPPTALICAVRAAVALLDEPARTVIVRRYLSEETFSAIAQQTGISPSSGRRLEAEAHEHLRDIVTALLACAPRQPGGGSTAGSVGGSSGGS